MALDKHWHLGCFRCRVCSKVLNAEYISRWVSQATPPGGPRRAGHASNHQHGDSRAMGFSCLSD